MLSCMAHSTMEKINAKQPTKTISSQIKDMALKASGAYRHCTPCANQPADQQNRNPPVNFGGGEAPEKSRRTLYRRTWSSSSGRKELEARLKVISSRDGTPATASGRRVEPVVFVEENEPKEWVAQVEPGVLITFLSLPKGGNDLKRVRFSEERFNKWQAHTWWTENCEKVMELYNVQRLNHQAFPLPISDEEADYTPKVLISGGGGVKTEISSFRGINGSCLDTEWVEEDEPGVYLTIRAMPDGRKELRRVRFSREKFKEMHAKLWWEENRARINKQYL